MVIDQILLIPTTNGSQTSQLSRSAKPYGDNYAPLSDTFPALWSDVLVYHVLWLASLFQHFLRGPATLFDGTSWPLHLPPIPNLAPHLSKIWWYFDLHENAFIMQIYWQHVWRPALCCMLLWWTLRRRIIAKFTDHNKLL